MEANAQTIDVTISFPENWEKGRIRDWLAQSQKVQFIGYRSDRWNRQFVAYFAFVKWSQLSLGITLDVNLPNFEIHVPFGFVRVGWVKIPRKKPVNHWVNDKTTFGIRERYET